MIPQAEALYHLQQIDLEILRHRKRLKEIATALGDNAVVQDAQSQLTTAQENLKPLRTQVRNLELEIQTTSQKAKTTEDRLYSGSVKNPKELQEMQLEIESLKKRNAELEESLLEQMVLVEDAEAFLSEKETLLNSVTSQWEGEHQDLLTEQKDLNTKVETLKMQRETAVKNVSPPNLKLYDEMKVKKANQPISAMRGNSCSLCGVEQTMAIEGEVRRAVALVNCSNCGRILVAVK